jgi:hypothetical protein
MPNPYTVLGVPSDVGPEALKRAYRKLVFNLHPDRNPDPTAVEKFREAVTAYNEVLRHVAKGPPPKNAKRRAAKRKASAPPTRPTPTAQVEPELPAYWVGHHVGDEVAGIFLGFSDGPWGVFDKPVFFVKSDKGTTWAVNATLDLTPKLREVGIGWWVQIELTFIRNGSRRGQPSKRYSVSACPV